MNRKCAATPISEIKIIARCLPATVFVATALALSVCQTEIMHKDMCPYCPKNPDPQIPTPVVIYSFDMEPVEFLQCPTCKNVWARQL